MYKMNAAESISRRAIGYAIVKDLIKVNKSSEYAGRIIVPRVVAEAISLISDQFDLNIVTSDIDTRYFKDGVFADKYSAQHHQAVFVWHDHTDTEYSLENLPFTYQCGWSSSSIS